VTPDLATRCHQILRHARCGRKECAKNGFPFETDRCFEKSRAARKPRAFDPLPRAVTPNRDILRESPAGEAFARKATAEADDLPAEERRIACERNVRLELGHRTVEHDRL